VIIRNLGSSVLRISSISRSILTGSNWLSISPASANIQPEGELVLNLSFNAGSNPTGIYEAAVNIRSNDPVNGFVVMPVSLQINSRPTANFSASPMSGLSPLTVQFTDLSVPLPGALSRLPDLLEFGVTTIGRATVAVSMIVAGSRISVLRPASIQDPQVWLVSTLRLVVIPVLAILMLNRMELGDTARGVLCVVAVMPAAVTSLIFSERFNGDSEFIAASLLLTHLFAVVTVPVLLLWAL